MPAKAPILVVDDDDLIREALRDTLELEGFPVVELANGLAALNYLETHPRPMLILLDWNMAPIGGPEFMRELAKTPHLDHVPVVLITADGRAEQKCKQAVCAGYLNKPVDLTALFKVVHHYAGV